MTMGILSVALLCRLYGRRPACHNDVHVQTDQLGREAGEPVVLPLRPAELDGDVLTFHIAQLTQSLPKGLNKTQDSWLRRGRPGLASLCG